jgi:hypothetical protein
MPDPDDEATPVSHEEIAYVARKLDEWARSLPAKEQALVQLIVSNARLVEPEDVFRAQAKWGIEQAALVAFREVATRWNKADAYWMKVGPVWQKANPAGLPDDGFEFPIQFESRER